MINKSKIYGIFGEMRKIAEKESTLVVVMKNNILESVPLDIDTCNRLERDFLESRKIMGSSICEIAEIFTVGKALFEFENPSASEVRSAVIKNFEHQNSIIFQVKDEDGFLSLYYYHKSAIGDPNGIRANHKTIYFETGRCFYTSYLKSIIPVKEILLS